MTYHTARPAPPAARSIRIRKAGAGPWQPCPLLASAAGWVKVDDGNGPLWVMVDHINRLDWPALAIFERLREARN